jgi:hypothetical protein
MEYIEFERIWKIVAMILPKYYPSIFPRETEENHEIPNSG